MSTFRMRKALDPLLWNPLPVPGSRPGGFIQQETKMLWPSVPCPEPRSNQGAGPHPRHLQRQRGGVYINVINIKLHLYLKLIHKLCQIKIKRRKKYIYPELDMAKKVCQRRQKRCNNMWLVMGFWTWHIDIFSWRSLRKWQKQEAHSDLPLALLPWSRS